LQKALLIAGYRQQVIGSFVVENLRHGFMLRVHRVQADHLAGTNRRTLNQLLRGWNFVALVGHRFDAQAAVRRQTDRSGQVHFAVFDGFAVNGHQRIGVGAEHRVLTKLAERLRASVAAALIASADESRSSP